MIFDPSLDSSLKIVNPSGAGISGSTNGSWSPWFWYPGQRSSHLHKIKVLESIKRFRYVGYPGSFRQPLYHVYFKKSLTLKEGLMFEWRGNGGRIRMNIDGHELDITEKSCELEAGEHELLVSLDYCESLPALILNCDDRTFYRNWLVSRDRIVWDKPEFLDEFSDPLRAPISPRESLYSIPPQDGPRIFELKSDSPQVLDFHYYEMGHVELEAMGEGEIRIVVGQSAEEAGNCIEEYFEQKQSPPEKLSDSFRIFKSSYQALRFVSIRCSGSARIRNIQFIAAVSPVEHTGSFKCRDKELNAFWDMGAATIHSCMHDFFLDAAYRDALPWAPDGVMAMTASDSLFNDRVTARQQVESQLLPEGADKGDLGVLYLDFQLYCIMGFQQEYQATGDSEFLKRHSDSLFRVCDIYLDLLDERGFLSSGNAGGMTFFPDWSVDEAHGPDLKGSPAYAQMLLYNCLNFCRFTAALFSHSEREEWYRKNARELRNRILDAFWDSEKSRFINGYHSDGSRDLRISVYAQTFGVIFALTPEEGLSNAAVLLGSSEHRSDSLSISFPFQMIALAELGETMEMTRFLRKVLGPVVEAGDVRIFEDIRYSGERTLDFYGRPFGKSLCHSVMGAAPVLGIQHALLGLRPVALKPGQFSLIPPKFYEVEDLLPIEGTIASAGGSIAVRYSLDEIVIDIEDSACLDLPAFIGYETDRLKGKGQHRFSSELWKQYK